jgi:hypothetical protein
VGLTNPIFTFRVDLKEADIPARKVGEKKRQAVEGDTRHIRETHSQTYLMQYAITSAPLSPAGNSPAPAATN